MNPGPDIATMAPRTPVGVGLLVRMKCRTLLNRLRQQAMQSPVKATITAGFLALIWVGLYWLFRVIFDYFDRTPLEAAVAVPMVFNFFFLAMLVMLTISNAIIAYVSLFVTDEAAYLLAAPVQPRAYVLLKYLETLIFSSWSLVLLGLPLMVAMADTQAEPWYYYPLFIAFFLCFVPIPGAAGMIVAWATAHFLTRRSRRRLVVGLAVGCAVAIVWFLQSMQVSPDGGERWLRDFLFRIGFIQHALLPNVWVTKGVSAAMLYKTNDALAYLAVTLSSGLFASLVAVWLVAGRFFPALDRALSSRGSDRRPATVPDGGVAGRLFFYLPLRLRLIAAKDLRTFLRDPLQWTQLVILFGLMILYLINLPRFAAGKPLEGWGMIIPFLNFGAISFILATFTSRFVFPMVSMEGLQMWLIGLLPITAGEILVAKFAFAMTVSVTVVISTTLLAAAMLQMPAAWALLQVTATFAVCVGLCGCAVGVGARLPVFGERNAARIANGFGGTINLVMSVALVLMMLVGMSILGWHNRMRGFSGPIDGRTLLIAAAVVVWGIGCGVAAMIIGARHLRRAEV